MPDCDVSLLQTVVANTGLLGTAVILGGFCTLLLLSAVDLVKGKK